MNRMSQILTNPAQLITIAGMVDTGLEKKI
jgi:hypothetical protein